MITKATIEQVISNYQYRVRIPVFNRIKGVNLSTPTNELAIATVATLPNITPNYKLGDVVYVGFEDNRIGQPVILGVLSAKNVAVNTLPDVNANSINVKTMANLTGGASIGEVTNENIQCLIGSEINIRDKFKSIETDISHLVDKVSILSIILPTLYAHDNVLEINTPIDTLEQITKYKLTVGYYDEDTMQFITIGMQYYPKTTSQILLFDYFALRGSGVYRFSINCIGLDGKSESQSVVYNMQYTYTNNSPQE